LKTLFVTKQGFLFSSGAACSQARFVAFSFAQSGIALESFENPVSNETGFFVFKRCKRFASSVFMKSQFIMLGIF
jgi:hypothetical protein